MTKFVRTVGGLVLAAGLLAATDGPATGSPAPDGAACAPRVLVLAAFPAEIGRLLDATHVDARVTIDGRRFYVGTLRGHDVVLALTGIGLVNAEKTTRDAYAHFVCDGTPGLSSVVFSGVAGGDFIGDVAVPREWTEDGTTLFPVDTAMFETAAAVAASGAVTLARRPPLGDVACGCLDPDLVHTKRLPHQPQIRLGGAGISSDPFNGRAFPCIPRGGDVFGCEPCKDQGVPDLRRFAYGALPFVDPDFFLGYFESPPVADPRYEAQDMETAAVARVAAEHATPFIGFRGVSDGGGDPLKLPGFPFQFFVYRQLAADNAAAVTLAFLEKLVPV